MQIRCKFNGKIYKVIDEDKIFYIVEGLFLGVPIKMFKSDCEVLKND